MDMDLYLDLEGGSDYGVGRGMFRDALRMMLHYFYHGDYTCDVEDPEHELSDTHAWAVAYYFEIEGMKKQAEKILSESPPLDLEHAFKVAYNWDHLPHENFLKGVVWDAILGDPNGYKCLLGKPPSLTSDVFAHASANYRKKLPGEA